MNLLGSNSFLLYKTGLSQVDSSQCTVKLKLDKWFTHMKDLRQLANKSSYLHRFVTFVEVFI